MNKRLMTELARDMRREPTPCENMFWQAVRGRKLDGVKFRRQQVIEHFIVDFFVPSHRLVVEIDGDIHLGQQEQDAVRQQFFEDCGLNVMRFTNQEIEADLNEVLGRVRAALKPHPLTPTPSGGEDTGR